MTKITLGIAVLLGWLGFLVSVIAAFAHAIPVGYILITLFFACLIHGFCRVLLSAFYYFERTNAETGKVAAQPTERSSRSGDPSQSNTDGSPRILNEADLERLEKIAKNRGKGT